MLTEDNVFEVVFNPGSDKREKWIPGPVFSLGEDTGGVRLTKTSRESSTQLFKSIGARVFGQSFCMNRIPVAKGLRGGYAYAGEGNNAMRFRQVGHRINLLPPPQTQNRAANQKKRHIRTNLSCDFEAFCSGKLPIQLVFHSNQRGGGIR